MQVQNSQNEYYPHYLHDRINSLRWDVWAHKTNLIPLRLVKVVPYT
jgi:hypothetical protein